MTETASSPELVLVGPPEAAEAARRALPERPWEQFALPRQAAAGSPPRHVQGRRRRSLGRATLSALALTAAATVIFASVRISGALNTIETPKETQVSSGQEPPPPGAGYVLVGALAGRGAFRIDPTGRFVVSFRIATRCGEASVARIPISPDLQFSYRGGADAPVRVTVRAAFRGRQQADGIFEVRTGACDTGAVPLSARLS